MSLATGDPTASRAPAAGSDRARPPAGGAPLVVDGLGRGRTGVVAVSVRDPARPGAGNVSLVVGPQGHDGGDVRAERARLLAAMCLAPGRAVVMDQVHGAGVAVVGDADAGRGLDDHATAVAAVDALVTTDVDLGLVVLVADCVPVALIAPGAVAAVHAGRRGVVADVVGAALDVLRDRSAVAPGDITAVIGPAIGGCCYEVPEALAEEVGRAHPSARTTTTWGSPSLDLVAAGDARLHAAGVADVQRLGGCTRHASDPAAAGWFSHRADPDAGRHALVVARRAAPAAAPGSAFLDSNR